MKGLNEIDEEEKKKRTLTDKLKERFERMKNLANRRASEVELKRNIGVERSRKVLETGAKHAGDSFKKQAAKELGKKYGGVKRNPFAYRKAGSNATNFESWRFSPASFLSGNTMVNKKYKNRLVIKL